MSRENTKFYLQRNQRNGRREECAGHRRSWDFEDRAQVHSMGSRVDGDKQSRITHAHLGKTQALPSDGSPLGPLSCVTETNRDFVSLGANAFLIPVVSERQGLLLLASTGNRIGPLLGELDRLQPTEEAKQQQQQRPEHARMGAPAIPPRNTRGQQAILV
ncbi:folylpolyglutamate synthase [Platysternon megacephalum]|uniref:Folylpolyglutamate synthase n=1 Tax=Platysternon megacephalum TaxID=55544 RepID=A0A4D9DE56_9SAUR|nr:folylpolyglutamate synthase [Platysternon megacephalum]